MTCPRCGDPATDESALCIWCQRELEDATDDPNERPEDAYGISMDMLAGDALNI